MWLNFTEMIKNHDYKWKFKLIICLPIIITLIAIDWAVKGWVVANMQQNEFRDFISGFVNLEYIINLGSAYGKGADNPKITILLASLATIVILLAFIFMNSKKWLIGLSFLLSGSLANLVARSWAPADINGIYGGVVDMFRWDFNFLGSNGYIFNLADMWVNFGVGLFAIATIWELIIWIKPSKNKDVLSDEIKDEERKEH